MAIFSNYNINLQQMRTKQDPVSQFYTNYSKPNLIGSSTSKTIILIALLFVLSTVQATDFTDNTCTFKINGKLYSLAYLNKKARSQQNYYSVKQDNNTQIDFNFCEPFLPNQCQGSNLPSSFSYIITREKHIDNVSDPLNPKISQISTCVPYSSNSKISNYNVANVEKDGDSIVNLTLSTQPDSAGLVRRTIFLLECNQTTKEIFEDVEVDWVNNYTLVIKGQSPYACPIFTMQNIWQALANNKIIFGIILFVIGFIMLFYGVLMIHLMVFLTTYFLSFAALLSIFSAFLNPESVEAIIYFSLLFILFLSTLIAYGLAKIVNFSVFFIGAFFGFIIAALVNTIFVKLFSVYSIWSLIFFEVIFTIPLGLLTFKYNKQIIVLSTSLAGAYMIVRPFSWIFGGFPNQFTLYQSIQDGQTNVLSWGFFIYLIFILAIFAVGAHYQLLKIARKNNDTEQVNYLPGAMQENLDLIHQHVQNLINKYSKNENQNKNEDYTKMEGEVRRSSNQKRAIELQAIKQRKSKENIF